MPASNRTARATSANRGRADANTPAGDTPATETSVSRPNRSIVALIRAPPPTAAAPVAAASIRTMTTPIAAARSNDTSIRPSPGATFCPCSAN